jgi:DNA-binding NarL/FixJ family response regulator
LIEQGEVEAGLSLLDEAMVAVTANELSPLFTGLIYCSVIDACQRVYALGRAREWTSAMTAWCAGQPQMIAFSGTCLVHRAEVLRLHGAWDDALDEVRSAGERFTRGGSQKPPAAAYYQQGELCRLRGEFEAAEDFYRRASLSGLEPQPGLSLLRVAQGKPDVALAAMRRVLATVSDRLQRMRLLPAEVEIALIVGKLDAARGACDELERIAESFATDVSSAIAAQARGAVSLAGKDVQAASHSLRRAAELWERVKAPYEVACVRVLLARAFRVLGDDEGMRLELDAARAVFQQLGALPDLARVDALGHDPEPVAAHGLSRRELQVLRLVAAGKSNKGIARELGLSEKTVERHLSNIFAKLDVASRAGATAYAYEHQLVEKRPSAP